MHSLGLVGGTFDRFHAGHRALIEHGLSKCQRARGMVNERPNRLRGKRLLEIESWSERSLKFVESIGEEFLSNIHPFTGG